MKELLTALLAALLRGEDLVLCGVIASSGSTPRGSGARMVLFQDGTTQGTVGGGAVEYESIRLAKQALQTKAAFTQGFNLTKNEVADIGMICGGQVVIYFRYFSAADPQAQAFAAYAAGLFDRSVNSWLVTELKSEGVGRMGVYTREEGPRFLGDMDAKRIEPLACAQARREGELYVEPLTRAEQLYIFGGGHVSRELAPLAARVGFSVTVLEDRADFADPKFFSPQVKTCLCDFAAIGASAAVTEEDYAVVMTRGHQSDYTVLEQLLRTKACYIGVIGSRHKVAATNRRLVEAGIPEAELCRIHSPIGLAIGAETPAEIAVSVAAELILHRAKRNGGKL